MNTGLEPRRKELLRGVIEIRGILGEAVEELGTRIVGGQWAPGETIPTEAELCQMLGVSRSVVREAFRILGAKGLIRSRTSDGTRVLPRNEWRLLDPDVMQWRIAAGDTNALLLDLVKVRDVIEPGAVFAATRNADADDRARVQKAWEAKDALLKEQDPDPADQRERFIETDLGFHRALWHAVDSDLLCQLYTVIESVLRLAFDVQMRARGYETELTGMDESHELHRIVYGRFIAGDAEGAEAAMRELISRAKDDVAAGMALLEQVSG